MLWLVGPERLRKILYLGEKVYSDNDTDLDSDLYKTNQIKTNEVTRKLVLWQLYCTNIFS